MDVGDGGGEGKIFSVVVFINPGYYNDPVRSAGTGRGWNTLVPALPEEIIQCGAMYPTAIVVQTT